MKLLLFSTQSCSSINILPENVLSREQSATKYSNGIKVERKNAGRNSATQTEMTGLPNILERADQCVKLQQALLVTT